MFIISFFKTILYVPLYNALVFLIHIVPGGEVGIALILLTVIVKLLLFPLSAKSIKSQAQMRDIEPKIKKIRNKKLDRAKEAEEIMAVYKENKVNPFSGCLLLLIQFPIIISLYWVFLKGLPNIDPALLYSFTPEPGKLNMVFLGILDLQKSSIVMALLAGITQFFQMRLSLPTPPKKDKNKKKEKNLQEEITRTMNTQMKYVLPIFITGVAYSLNAAVALYWVVNNLFMICQELWVRHSRKKDKVKEVKK